MKKRNYAHYIVVILVVGLLSSCATHNAQWGALGGGAVGAAAGQAIGGNRESTLIGAGVGTLLGFITGDYVDKKNQAEYNAYLQQQNQQRKADLSDPYAAAEAGRREGIAAGKRRAAQHNYSLSKRRAAEKAFNDYKIE